jgi:hypothetical protein
LRRNPKSASICITYVLTMRRTLAIVLAVLLAGSPGGVISAPALGRVQGVVTVGGRPLAGIALALVDIESGSVQRVTSTDAGIFTLQVPPGRYVVTTENHAGLAVDHAPAVIPVTAGQVASASIDLLPLPVALAQTSQVPSQQQPPAPEGAAPLSPAPPPETGAPVINHDPVGCFIAGEFPLLDAGIDPAGTVARARVYFKSNLGNAYYYIEMTQTEGRFFGKLPRPQMEASPITYYIQATSTEFGESQTPEIEALVVKEAKDCPADSLFGGHWGRDRPRGIRPWGRGDRQRASRCDHRGCRRCGDCGCGDRLHPEPDATSDFPFAPCLPDADPQADADADPDADALTEAVQNPEVPDASLSLHLDSRNGRSTCSR